MSELEIEGVEYEKTASGKFKTATVTLDFPISTPDGAERKTLKFRRMKTSDTYAGEGIENEAEAGIAVFARLAGIPLEEFGEVDLEDLDRISEAVIPLMGKSAAEAVKAAKANA